MTISLSIDLDDGSPPSEVIRVEKPAKAGSYTPIRFRAPETVIITSTPVAIVISYAPISCLGCGAEHRDHRGIFLESRLSNRVIHLQRKSLRELAAYADLPRRVDLSPREAIPICADCWIIEKCFRDAVAVAQAEGELFGEPGAPSEIASIASELEIIHRGGAKGAIPTIEEEL